MKEKMENGKWKIVGEADSSEGRQYPDLGEMQLSVVMEPTSGYRNFQDLECWKACVEFRRYVSRLLKKFPKSETYNLISQMRKASRSPSANIAEGYGRFHFQENIQFCRIGRGSLFEMIDHLLVALDEEYITQEEHQEACRIANKSISILNGYIKFLATQKASTPK